MYCTFICCFFGNIYISYKKKRKISRWKCEHRLCTFFHWIPEYQQLVYTRKTPHISLSAMIIWLPTFTHAMEDCRYMYIQFKYELVILIFWKTFFRKVLLIKIVIQVFKKSTINILCNTLRFAIWWNDHMKYRKTLQH